MRLLDGINDTEDELYTFDSIMETKATSKGLEALKQYRNQQTGVNVYADDYLDIIEKELKALDILKDMLEIETDSFDGSDMEFHTIRRLRFKQDCGDISEDEYNLLKEVL